jgi:hypothetical protein
MTTDLAATRASLHAVAEHVLAAARYQAVGRIGLVPAPRGFATPPFAGTIVAVDGTDLVLSDGGGGRRAPISTLRAAGQLVGVQPGMPDVVYRPATLLDLDRDLPLDARAAELLAGWFALGAEALARFAAEIPGDEPSAATLWPEHFDLALSADEVNYGVSPGDDAIPEPYAYVGPWARPLPGDPSFWNEPFGSALLRSDVAGVDDLVAFFRAGRAATRSP